MARIRRLAVLVGAVALTGAFVAGPAQADSPEVFSGSAAGTALDLSVLGKQATFGSSAAKVNSAGVATSKGAGLLAPTTTVAEADALLGNYSSAQEADAESGETVTQARLCQAAPALPSTLDFIDLGLVCSSASADNGNHPSAEATGSIAELDVNAESIVPQEVSDNEIGATLAGALTPICEAIQTHLPQDNEAGVDNDVACDAQTTVKDLVESVLETQTLDVEVGESTSKVTTGPSTVTSEATASGATIKILPLPQVNGLPSSEPVVTISVGEAKAKTVYDRGTGTATADADPAIVRIKLNTALDTHLPQDEFIVAPDTLTELAATLAESDNAHAATDGTAEKLITVCEDRRAVCVLPGTPLESRVYFAGKSEKVNPDGTATAVADGVRVDVLHLSRLGVAVTADQDPAIRLALGHAEAAVGGRQAQVTPPNNDNNNGNGRNSQELPRAGEPPQELPRTGGTPWVPMLGAAGLALAVTLRRATLKATR